MSSSGSNNNNDSDDDDFEKELSILAKDLKENLEIKDRKYHLKTYKECFVGKEAVDYLVSAGHAPTREDAVTLGRALQSSTHMFEHVTRDHEFSDENLFFRFLKDSERGGLSISPKTGDKVQWGDFLSPMNNMDDNASTSSLQPSFPQTDFQSLNPKDVHVASKIWPMDEHNTTLLNHVHPPEWKDPPPGNSDGKSTNYDVVVIGAGAGGLISAAASAGLGAKVAMIEEHMLGGDCLNVGCVPSKTIIHSATLAHQLKMDTERLAAAGITVVNPSENVKIDFEKVMERVRQIRAEISHHDSATRYSQELGVDVFIGRGKFASERSVIVNDKTLYFKKAVIATGGYPTLIPMPGLQDLYNQATEINSTTPRPVVMTNETFFNLTKQPKHLVVVGAGVIGMELAQSMQRLGTSVTVLGRSGSVLPKEDDDMAQIVKDQMVKDGVTFKLFVSEYKNIKLTGNILEENGYPEMVMTIVEKDSSNGAGLTTTLICDAVLIAAGRRPNVTGMDLELAKVEYDTKEGLKVNDNLRTTNPRIYGVGDCCSKFKFTHAADFMAQTVVKNALFYGNVKMSNLLIPYATFTQPEIASVGLYGSDLDAQGIPYRTFEKYFKDNDRAICDDNTVGFVRFRVDAKKDTILGCSIVGENAGNMISEITLAMKSGTGLSTMATVIHPYPTTADVLRLSGNLYNKTKLTNTAKKLLRGIIKMQS